MRRKSALVGVALVLVCVLAGSMVAAISGLDLSLAIVLVAFVVCVSYGVLVVGRQ